MQHDAKQAGVETPPMKKKKSAFFHDGISHASRDMIEYVFGRDGREAIARLTDLHPEVVSSRNFDDHCERLQDLEVIFSTWGMAPLTVEQIRRLPNLKCVFYAAGASRWFRQPFIECGVRVMTATAANAISVAEFCLAQILLAMTGYFRNTREAVSPETANPANGYVGPGNFGEKVALIGDGSVSRHLQALLRPFDLKTEALSSYVQRDDEDLSRIFREAYVISNHLPDIDETEGILDRALFESMRPGAVFINTGRGRQVNEADLAGVFERRSDLTALLDVVEPEPPVEGSPLYSLPNVHLSTHLAGAKNDEVTRLAKYMIEDFQRWERGEPMLHEVTGENL